MVYANDSWILLPVKDIFDTTMMQMALNTAKEMYEKGELQIKDFHKLYDDFYSPSPGWNKWYAENVTNPFNEGVNYLYQNGIDPLRSPEGRSYIRNLVNRVPRQMLTRAKAESAMMEAYLKNAAELDKKGLRNIEMDKLLQNGVTISNYNPETDAPWEWVSPQPYVGLKGATSDWFKDLDSSLLYRGSFDENGKPKVDPKGQYNFYGITPEALRLSIGNNIDSFISTPQGRYEADIIRRQLEAEGKPATEQAVRERLGQAIADANSGKLKLDYKVNPEWEAEQKQALMRIAHSGSRYASSSRGGNNGYYPSEQLGTSYSRAQYGSGKRNILLWMTPGAIRQFTNKKGEFNESAALWFALKLIYQNQYNRSKNRGAGILNTSLINKFSFNDNARAMATALNLAPNSNGVFSLSRTTASLLLNRDNLILNIKRPEGTKWHSDSSRSQEPRIGGQYKLTGRVVAFINTGGRFVEYAEVERIPEVGKISGEVNYYIKLPQQSLQNSSHVDEQSILNARSYDEIAYGPLNIAQDAYNQNETLYGEAEFPIIDTLLK